MRKILLCESISCSTSYLPIPNTLLSSATHLSHAPSPPLLNNLLPPKDQKVSKPYTNPSLHKSLPIPPPPPKQEHPQNFPAYSSIPRLSTSPNFPAPIQTLTHHTPRFQPAFAKQKKKHVKITGNQTRESYPDTDGKGKIRRRKEIFQKNGVNNGAIEQMHTKGLKFARKEFVCLSISILIRGGPVCGRKTRPEFIVQVKFDNKSYEIKYWTILNYSNHNSKYQFFFN